MPVKFGTATIRRKQSKLPITEFTPQVQHNAKFLSRVLLVVGTNSYHTSHLSTLPKDLHFPHNANKQRESTVLEESVMIELAEDPSTVVHSIKPDRFAVTWNIVRTGLWMRSMRHVRSVLRDEEIGKLIDHGLFLGQAEVWWSHYGYVLAVKMLLFLCFVFLSRVGGKGNSRPLTGPVCWHSSS